MKKQDCSKEKVGYAEVDSVEIADMQSNLDETGTVDLTKEGEDDLQQQDFSLAEVVTFEPIKEKIEEARAMAADLDLFANRTAKQLAEKAIRLGLVLLEIKSFVRKSDEAWEEWANEHLTFIGERNRQKFMMLAKRLDCHQHTYLGLDRLEKVCSATKGSDEEDPIGTLLKKYGIVVDETSEFDLEEFRAKVDVALTKEKLEKHHIPVGLELVNDLTRKGINFDDRLLKKLSNLTEAGEDPEAYLKGLSSQEKKDESEPSAEVRLKDSFNSLAHKMIETVDYILKYPEQSSKIDWESFEVLLQRLTQLQIVMAAKIDAEQEKAA